MVPKLAAPELSVELGLLKLTRLRRLKASARNSIDSLFSRIGKIRDSAVSNSRYLGPGMANAAAGLMPKVPFAGAVKDAKLSHGTVFDPLAGVVVFGGPTRLARILL